MSMYLAKIIPVSIIIHVKCYEDVYVYMYRHACQHVKL